ncbi:MAG: ferritin family protein [Armatimonadota bacterium]
MATILVVDTVGDSRAKLDQALRREGWTVRLLDDPMRCCEAPADAVVVATDSAGLGRVQQGAARLREQSNTPVILLADLDRSGWDRTFGAAGGLQVDALLDSPVDAGAVVARLKAVLASREGAKQLAASPDMRTILDRAIANEDASVAFYRQGAARATAPETRDALEMLAKEEEEHKRVLEQFRDGRRPLPSGAAEAASLAEAFGTPEFSAEMSPADAFVLAARKERLATEMYRNWAALYQAGAERDLLLRLAEMEQQHEAHVEAMLANASFPEVW